jgi:hypothetical protein
MFRRRALLLACVLLLFAARPARAQATPQEVSFCDLANNPKSFDGKMIRVRGSVSDEFEDFTLFAEGCHTQQGIWLTFGGDVPSTVISTVNDNFRKPGTDLKVNGVSYGVEKDESFRRFYVLIAARHGDKASYRVTATLTGPFFAGGEEKLPDGGVAYSGYGHVGCCSLLVITKVSDVESVPPANLNLSGIVLGPDGNPMKGFPVVNEVAGGSPPQRQQTTTDASGHFEFSDSGSVLRLEEPRYRPIALAIEPGGSPVRVRLENAKPTDWVIPSCGQIGGSARRIGFSALFALPSDLESNLSDTFGGRTYFISPHGGEPGDAELLISTYTDQAERESEDFISSKWSEQRWIKDSTGAIVGIDSRGQRENGEYWRTATFLGRDSVDYDLSSLSVARSMDHIIDSACIAKP